MKTLGLPLVLMLTGVVLGGCSSRDGERDRNDHAFMLQDSSDWGDAAGRVVNHLLGASPPRGGIWPAPDNQ